MPLGPFPPPPINFRSYGDNRRSRYVLLRTSSTESVSDKVVQNQHSATPFEQTLMATRKRVRFSEKTEISLFSDNGEDATPSDQQKVNNRLRLSSRHLKKLKKELLLGQAKVVLEDQSAAQTWKIVVKLYQTCLAFDPENRLHRAKLYAIRAQLTRAYLQSDEVSGVEKTILNFLYKDPSSSIRKSTLQCLASRAPVHRMTRFSLADRLFAHELAKAQGQALEIADNQRRQQP